MIFKCALISGQCSKGVCGMEGGVGWVGWDVVGWNGWTMGQGGGGKTHLHE